jgi:iron complex transport system ATP-binding protein
MAVVVNNLSFAYGRETVLRDVSFQAPAGKLTALLGRNGSGKSTLLKLLAGILTCPRGRIELMEQDLSVLTGAARARLVGYLPQFHQAVFSFAVEDVVLTGRAAYVTTMPASRDRDAADSAIRMVGIEHLRRRPYTELSGGERQLVMIARVLAQQPRIILLDEPLSHLDLFNQARLIGLLKRLTEAGMTVLAVLHDPNPALLFGDSIVCLRDGQVALPPAAGAPWDAVFLSEVYGLNLETVPYRGKALIAPAGSEGGNQNGNA